MHDDPPSKLFNGPSLRFTQPASKVVRSMKLSALLAAALAFFVSFDTNLSSSSAQVGIAAQNEIVPQSEKKLDPAAWGSNHAGKPVPDFVHGDECLFCHRNDIGPGWQKNPHGIAIRQAEDAPEFKDVFKGKPALAGVASQVEYFMGSRHRLRFLKKEGYGKFAMLDAQAELTNGRVSKWISAE